MAGVVAKYAARKMLTKEMNKYKDKKTLSSYDPFYEEIPHPRKPGKTKKVKKQVPAYIPENDANILARSRRTAYLLDCCLFNIFGVRFGWSSVIGIIPAAGDAIDLALAGNLVKKMTKVEGGLPWSVLVLMGINLIIDFFIGLIPVVGDLADAGFRANSKNVRLLEEHLDKKYKPKPLKDAEAELDERPPPATVFVEFSDDEEDRRNVYDRRHDDVRRPTRAYGGRRDRIADEEQGLPRYETHRSRNDRPSRNDTRSSRR